MDTFPPDLGNLVLPGFINANPPGDAQFALVAGDSGLAIAIGQAGGEVAVSDLGNITIASDGGDITIAAGPAVALAQGTIALLNDGTISVTTGSIVGDETLTLTAAGVLSLASVNAGVTILSAGGGLGLVDISNAGTIAFDVAGSGALTGVQTINGVGYPPPGPSQATYYKSVAQNLTSGTTDITFDLTGAWNFDDGNITHTNGTADFTVVQGGLYQLEFNAVVIVNGATWTTSTNKFVNISITRSPTAEQAILSQTGLQAVQNYGQSISSTFNLVAGDVINMSIGNTFTGGPAQAFAVANTFDLNTFFSWRYIS